MSLRITFCRGFMLTLLLYVLLFTLHKWSTQEELHVCDTCDWADEDQGLSSSCCFTNVCYYKQELRHCNASLKYSKFPKEIYLASRHYAAVRVSNDSLPFSCEDQPIMPGVSVLIQPHHLHQYGHGLIDNIFPIVLLVHHFLGFHLVPFQIVIENNEEVDLLQQYLPILPDTTAVKLRSSMCFEKLLFGVSKMTLAPKAAGYTSPDSTREIIPAAQHVPPNGREIFHNFVTSKLEIDILPFHKRNNIYILNRRSSPRAIFQFQEFLLQIQEAFAKITNISSLFTIKPLYFEDMHVVEQIKVMGTACILVGVSGSGMHNALYLPPRSASVEIVPGTHLFVNRELCAHSTSLYCEVIATYDYHHPLRGHFRNTSQTIDFTAHNGSDVVVAAKEVMPAIYNAAMYVLGRTEKNVPYVNWPQ